MRVVTGDEVGRGGGGSFAEDGITFWGRLCVGATRPKLEILNRAQERSFTIIDLQLNS
jgi:hypothetical protein